MEPIIQVKNLTHTYGAGTPFQRSAVDHMSFDAGSAATAAALFGDLLVGGVDLLHFFLRQICQRAVVVIVRVVFSGQIPISFLDFLIGCGPGDAQNLIRIVHVVSSISLMFFLC